MAHDRFLKIDGIKGESTDDKHKDEIEILAYTWSISQSSAGGRSTGGGANVGKVIMQDFTITKSLDKASPKLFLEAAKGTHIKEVTLTFHRATGEKQKFMEYKMTDVVISSYSVSGGGDELPVEQVSFNPAKIEHTYTATDHKTGKSAGDVKANWDQVANKGS